MGHIWDIENRFGKLLEVEITVAQAQAELGIIPKEAARSIRLKSKFSVKRILEIEAVTKHDVIAFVSNVAENVGPHGRYIHFGMTSSDVLDTAFSLQVREAGTELNNSLDILQRSFEKSVLKYKDVLCCGRTHGMHAEPTTFGLKMAGFLAELKRHRVRLHTALKQFEIAKLSGAVGTYSSQSPEVEKRVAKKLNLITEEVATQVIPRDRHAEVLLALAMLGSGFERLSVELRHLQRTEVGEVIEGFSKGQKGSSAMPHKKNPISAENITGLARLLRSYAIPALEDVALWHERDISHSSVERVVFPDAFIIADYASSRLASLMDNLYVDAVRMRENMDLSQGQLFSSHVLLALVHQGLSREDAYKIVQRISHSLVKGETLYNKLMVDPETRSLLKKKELDKIFSGERHLQNTRKIIKKVLSH
jgi:adenylosuccinate lyase